MTDKVAFKINRIVSFSLSEAGREKWLGILNGLVLKDTLSPTFTISMGVYGYGKLVVELSRDEVLSFRQQLIDYKLKQFDRASLFVPHAGGA